MVIVIMKQKRLTGFIGIRLSDRVQEAITHMADERELAIAELVREILIEGLRIRGVEVS